MKNAKKRRCDGAKAKEVMSAAVASSPAGFKGGKVVVDYKGRSDIADIFAIMRDKRRDEACQGGSSSGGLVQQRKAVGTAAQSVSDGLYHAPEKTLKLSDSVFFNVVSQRQKKRRKTKESTAVEVSEDLLQREGVDRIVTVDELQKITSSNPKAGTTANCPFDCDCCF
ncbi:hypothetical protein TraAM80_04011 [Trypanosoma rangeli]|uniref:Uncharacterized protein n=1 Tax=Trypanosoma rangeli TaxID=5698 RepID=A0A3R7KEU2_TRYRA|nr:uncharacterized protein TraAM80_04011 [Trypanosoma rangeli]RNF06507.1 hypothetical protein TraAM80_04011 [Trypanosoma rangeli]|eukprot:RNF06507.1 hypothetical protein TraAM80_04011 [Trypanosoma rangeli]